MKDENKKLNILFVARDDGGCGFYRCLQPANFLNRTGLANAVSIMKNPTQEQLLSADLVVMQEMGSMEAMNMAKFLIDNKVPFMCEVDDFLHHISPHNIHGYLAWNPSTLYVYRSMEQIGKGAGLTVSTNQLAREYFPYTQYIYVVPNYLDKDRWDVPQVKRNDGKIRIGWCGGNAHGDDLHMISKVLDRIVKEYEGKVVFETMGMTRQELGGAFPMAPTPTEPCQKCGFEGELHHFPGERYDDFPQVLASRGWDIAVAPVINNSFGNCKSDLKVKEYSAIGYATIASDVVPYREALKNGAPILLAETYDDWYNCLKELIDNSGKREEMSRKAKEWAQNNWIQDHILEIFEVYKDTVSRFRRSIR